MHRVTELFNSLPSFSLRLVQHSIQPHRVFAVLAPCDRRVTNEAAAKAAHLQKLAAKQKRGFGKKQRIYVPPAGLRKFQHRVARSSAGHVHQVGIANPPRHPRQNERPADEIVAAVIAIVACVLQRRLSTSGCCLETTLRRSLDVTRNLQVRYAIPQNRHQVPDRAASPAEGEARVHLRESERAEVSRTSAVQHWIGRRHPHDPRTQLGIERRRADSRSDRKPP